MRINSAKKSKQTTKGEPISIPFDYSDKQKKNSASDLFGQEILTRKCVIVILFLKEIVCACATNKQNIGTLCPENLEQ